LSIFAIRDAVEGDYAALCALWWVMDDLHGRLLPSFFRRPAEGAAPRARAEVQRLLRAPDELLRVASVGGDIVGLCHAQVYDTPPQLALTACRRTHIDSLIVAENARRRGVGRQLVDDAAAWGRSRGASELVLTVWEGNEVAEKFYASLGFQRVNSVMGRGI
jgi:ribosomal protein S18 acetylase RimI-like enzyme